MSRILVGRVLRVSTDNDRTVFWLRLPRALSLQEVHDARILEALRRYVYGDEQAPVDRSDWWTGSDSASGTSLRGDFISAPSEHTRPWASRRDRCFVLLSEALTTFLEKHAPDRVLREMSPAEF